MNKFDFEAIPDLQGCNRLLCIQPHPDDNEIGAGATIARLIRKGCHVTYITVTDGRLGSKSTSRTPNHMKKIRKEEQLLAGGFLGVSDQVFLDYFDFGDYSTSGLCEVLAGHIRRFKPDLIMTPDPWLPYEIHPDHIKTGLAATRAAVMCAYPFFPDEKCPEASWQVNGIAYYFSASPNTWIDVSDYWSCKQEAMLLHASQFDPDSYSLIERYLAREAVQAGHRAGCRLAECFKVLSPMQVHGYVHNLDNSL